MKVENVDFKFSEYYEKFTKGGSGWVYQLG